MEKCEDMIVNLYQLEPYVEIKDFCIKRIFVSDKDKLLDFVKSEFPKEKGWLKEIEFGMFQNPIQVFIAIKNCEIIGFCCYDCTAKGYLGPMGVSANMRGKKVGSQLLIKTLNAMKDAGYGYAIIGWVGSPRKFYTKVANATIIKGTFPPKTLYSNKIKFN